jgi:hypothetical protein
MPLDDNLIRQMLLAIEGDAKWHPRVEDSDHRTIRGCVSIGEGRGELGFVQLSPKGQKFVNLFRDEYTWEQAKRKIDEAGLEDLPYYVALLLSPGDWSKELFTTAEVEFMKDLQECFPELKP